MKIHFLKCLIVLPLIFLSKSLLTEEESVYCFVGDAGEVNPTQSMVVKALANSDCTVVWHLGDITQLGVQSINDPELKESFLNPFKPFLDTNIPFYLTVGNHDYKNFSKNDILKPTNKTIFAVKITESKRSLSFEIHGNSFYYSTLY